MGDRPAGTRPALLALLAGAAVLAHATSASAPAGVPEGAASQVYAAHLDDVSWHVDSSRFSCRLWQPVAEFGAAVFEIQAGNPLGFHLEMRRRLLAVGTAHLTAYAPQWDPDRRTVELGTADVIEAEQPLHTDPAVAQRMLDSLYAGMAPVLHQTHAGAWSGNDAPVGIALSPAGFRAAYRNYFQCLAQLLPVSFEQIARSRILFGSDQWQLSADARRQLDLIALYTQADRAVSELFVDGHTDDMGRRLHNLELSKKRAAEVTRYLVAKGIEEQRITTRYHGERYPVAANSSTANRLENRRVTIRLERNDG